MKVGFIQVCPTQIDVDEIGFAEVGFEEPGFALQPHLWRETRP